MYMYVVSNMHNIYMKIEFQDYNYSPVQWATIIALSGAVWMNLYYI